MCWTKSASPVPADWLRITFTIRAGLGVGSISFAEQQVCEMIHQTGKVSSDSTIMISALAEYIGPLAARLFSDPKGIVR